MPIPKLIDDVSHSAAAKKVTGSGVDRPTSVHNASIPIASASMMVSIADRAVDLFQSDRLTRGTALGLLYGFLFASMYDRLVHRRRLYRDERQRCARS